MKYFPGLVESKAEDDQVGWKLTGNDMKIWTIKLIGQLSYAIETHLNVQNTPTRGISYLLPFGKDWNIETESEYERRASCLNSILRSELMVAVPASP